MTRLSLDLILELVGQMADLVREAVGEDGEAVMISIRSPRQIVVTKVGISSNYGLGAGLALKTDSYIRQRRCLKTIRKPLLLSGCWVLRLIWPTVQNAV